MFDFWKVQSDKLLFPEIAWARPEQKSRAGKILIVGGGSGSFRSLALAYDTAQKTGAGEVKILAPDSLNKFLKINKLTDVVFTKSNHSGGFSAEAWDDFRAAEAWADAILLIGDTNKNSETAVLFEKFILFTDKPITITRDAVDILINSSHEILQKPNLTIIASFAQLQKIFSSVFYPKVLTFSLQLANFVEIIHKFTLTYPCLVAVFHAENLIFAQNGKVVSNPASSRIAKFSPLSLWSGQTPTEVAVWQMWSASKKLESSITAVGRDL